MFFVQWFRSHLLLPWKPQLCKIYKRCLVADHFGRNATDWELKEENDPKHMSRNGDRTIQLKELIWPSISPDLNSIEKLLKMNLAKKKKSSNLQGISFTDKKTMEEFFKEFNQSMENRISDVISNKRDFIMYWWSEHQINFNNIFKYLIFCFLWKNWWRPETFVEYCR